MDNSVAARRNPAYSMPILKQVVTGVVALKSKRGKTGRRALLGAENRSDSGPPEKAGFVVLATGKGLGRCCRCPPGRYTHLLIALNRI